MVYKSIMAKYIKCIYVNPSIKLAFFKVLVIIFSFKKCGFEYFFY